jgi:hypothetical protein
LRQFQDFALEESPSRVESKDHNKFYSVSVQLSGKVSGPVNEQTLDRNFTNGFQDSNISVNLYIRDPSNPQNLILQTIYPPQYFQGSDSRWEVCLFSSPFIFETNRIVSTPTNYQWYFPYYKKIYVFFRNRKTLKFNS